MLIHEDAVLALTQPRIDGTPRERLSLRVFPGLGSLQGLFQAPAGFLVIEQIELSVLHDLVEDLCQSIQVL